MFFHNMAPTVNAYFEVSKKSLLPPNKTTVLPNYIKSSMAQYNEFYGVCSIRKYQFNVAEAY